MYPGYEHELRLVVYPIVLGGGKVDAGAPDGLGGPPYVFFSSGSPVPTRFTNVSLGTYSGHWSGVVACA